MANSLFSCFTSLNFGSCFSWLRHAKELSEKDSSNSKGSPEASADLVFVENSVSYMPTLKPKNQESSVDDTNSGNDTTTIVFTSEISLASNSGAGQNVDRALSQSSSISSQSSAKVSPEKNQPASSPASNDSQPQDLYSKFIQDSNNVPVLKYPVRIEPELEAKPEIQDPTSLTTSVSTTPRSDPNFGYSSPPSPYQTLVETTPKVLKVRLFFGDNVDGTVVQSESPPPPPLFSSQELISLALQQSYEPSHQASINPNLLHSSNPNLSHLKSSNLDIGTIEKELTKAQSNLPKEWRLGSLPQIRLDESPRPSEIATALIGNLPTRLYPNTTNDGVFLLTTQQAEELFFERQIAKQKQKNEAREIFGIYTERASIKANSAKRVVNRQESRLLLV